MGKNHSEINEEPFLLHGEFSVCLKMMSKKKYKALKKSRLRLAVNAQVIVEETEFVLAAVALLPDVVAAITLLKSRYDWVAIVQIRGIHLLHLVLLRQLDSDTEIELPNMNSTSRNSDELQIWSQARELAMRTDDDEIEAFFQKPTTFTLSELQNFGLLKATVLDPSERRNFEVHLTESGRKLLAFDEVFSDPNEAIRDGLRSPKSKEAHAGTLTILHAAT